MVMHARDGGANEVMGLMQGYVAPHTIVVTDAFKLPVQGTETRVNAQEQGDMYTVAYLELSRQSGRLENAVGWYHSHPGYGCWLSGIDVETEALQQLANDPFAAVVIDPERTVSSGKVDIGAFRTYPQGYTPPEEHHKAGTEAIPMAKLEDFGVHANRYYPLEVSHYKSTLDNKMLGLLWNKYWVNTLSSSPLSASHDYGTKHMKDLGEKVSKIKLSDVGKGREVRSLSTKDEELAAIATEGTKIAMEETNGLAAAQVKENLFKAVPSRPRGTATAER
ncbi:COP9 signalosome catalytic subunit rri1 [Ascosphaera atra]|nr:COP9 signalosome catalytic subunit rri1 [Ascosphaera atra]